MTYGPASWPAFQLNEKKKIHKKQQNVRPCWELWKTQWLELFGLHKQLDNRHTWENQQKQMSMCRTYCHKKCCNEMISVWAPKIENESGVSKQPMQWDKEMEFVNWTWKRGRVAMTEQSIHLKAVWLKLFLAVMVQTAESLFSFLCS